MALIKCPECGKTISNDAVFCPFCGYPLAKKMQEEAEKERLASAPPKDCKNCCWYGEYTNQGFFSSSKHVGCTLKGGHIGEYHEKHGKRVSGYEALTCDCYHWDGKKR